MTTLCSAISPGTVQIVLDYLCPLTGAVPPHLLSRPLLQRHHFLAISPENAAEYLAWPSAEQSHAVHLLQTEPIPTQDHPFPVNYTADTENLVAHVRITPALRLLFLWDHTQGWQYHNVALMPFPTHSYSSFEKAFAAYSPDDFLPEPSYSIEITEDNDDDSYWSSYGGGDDSEHLPAANTLDPNPNSEDAYWAQYASVQGSGDSTLPSPHPEKKKITSGVDIAINAPQRIIIPSDDLQIYHGEVYNPMEPPEPSALARRLEALSAGSDPDSPTVSDDSPTSNSTTTSPERVNALLDHTDSISSSNSSHQPVDEFVVIDPDAAANVADPAQDVLRDSIKALYQMWKLGRQDKSLDNDKDLFMATVRQALDQL